MERDERTDLVPTKRGMKSAVFSSGLKTTVKTEAACSSELWEQLVILPGVNTEDYHLG
jgi:hypothetical protein